MAKVTDKTMIQFRMLNKGKGPAVCAPRAQADKKLYQAEMRRVLESQDHLTIKQALIDRILLKDMGKDPGYSKQVAGVVTNTGMEYRAKVVILAPGTFLNGLIHIGLESYPAGRAGEFSAPSLSNSLKNLGLELKRLKTGTSPRIDGRTVNFLALEIQYGNEPPRPFSFQTESIETEQLPCYITYTNERTKKIILSNLDRSPLYTKKIKGIGPRYCPSIEDKVVRFAEKERHQVFLEPEGRGTNEYYVNGLSTSLPEDVQIALLRTVKGLEEVEILRPGYAIEYDFVPPTQIYPWLETKTIQNLFLAGQINGTSGYEEAAAQGIMAGINSVLKIREEKPFILDRSEAYIGVLIDDLVTKGTEEPYRLFTSRAEYRLLLRQDNADERLMRYGQKFGLISSTIFKRFEDKLRLVEEEIERLFCLRKKPEEVNPLLRKLNSAEVNEEISLAQLLKRPKISYKDLSEIDSVRNELPRDVVEEVEIKIKYEGYIKRQILQAEKMKRLEEKEIPEKINYQELKGLSTEARLKLEKIRPRTLGQASRISGVSPADVSILIVYLQRG